MDDEERQSLIALKIESRSRFSALGKKFRQQYADRLSWDIMCLANLFVEESVGLAPKLGAEAMALFNLDVHIAAREHRTDFPTWRACRLILENLLDTNRLFAEQLTLATALMVRIDKALPSEESIIAERQTAAQPDATTLAIGWESLLHPLVKEHALDLYEMARYRDAVLSALVALADVVRHRTGLDLDGAALFGEALSLQRPHLLISSLATESGKNEQKGFMQMLQGVFIGLRNPAAHSLHSRIDGQLAAQYLVMVSALARVILEAVPVTQEP